MVIVGRYTRHYWAFKEAPASEHTPGLAGQEACLAWEQLHPSQFPLQSDCMRIHRTWRQPSTTQKQQASACGKCVRKVSETSSSALIQVLAMDGRPQEPRMDLDWRLRHTHQ